MDELILNFSKLNKNRSNFDDIVSFIACNALSDDDYVGLLNAVIVHDATKLPLALFKREDSIALVTTGFEFQHELSTYDSFWIIDRLLSVYNAVSWREEIHLGFKIEGAKDLYYSLKKIRINNTNVTHTLREILSIFLSVLFPTEIKDVKLVITLGLNDAIVLRIDIDKIELKNINFRKLYVISKQELAALKLLLNEIQQHL